MFTLGEQAVWAAQICWQPRQTQCASYITKTLSFSHFEHSSCSNNDGLIICMQRLQVPWAYFCPGIWLSLNKLKSTLPISHFGQVMILPPRSYHHLYSPNFQVLNRLHPLARQKREWLSLWAMLNLGGIFAGMMKKKLDYIVIQYK